MSPLDQAIIEIVCCMRKQTKSKKIRLLSPHSEKYHYIVDRECIHFLPCPLNTPGDIRPEFSLSLNTIFSILRTRQYIYIYCYEDILYLLDVKSNSLYLWAAEKAVRRKIYLKSYSIGINTIWHKLTNKFVTNNIVSNKLVS